jgi:16S rRNA (uracil1498-N3)-methyltransferase
MAAQRNRPGDRGAERRGARVRSVLIPERWIDGDRARIEGAIHHHLAHVLRLGPGDAVALCDEGGAIHRGQIVSVTTTSLEVAIEEHQPPVPAPRPRVTLIHGLSRRARSEWVLQKATELGVDAILLATCARSVAHPGSDRLPRWEEIVRQAARQSGRSLLPQVLPPAPLALLLEGCAGDGAQLRLVCHPGGVPLAPLLTEGGSLDELVLAVGPEGGFEEAELAAAEARGFRRVGLGPQVLRTETAAIAALTLCLALGGRWAR